jgi:hypothetical protein
MIDQALTNATQLVLDLDAELLELVGRTDAALAGDT